MIGAIQTLLGKKRWEIGSKLDPNSCSGQKITLKCPKIAPKGPHQHSMVILSPSVHDLGLFIRGHKMPRHCETLLFWLFPTYTYIGEVHYTQKFNAKNYHWLCWGEGFIHFEGASPWFPLCELFKKDPTHRSSDLSFHHFWWVNPLKKSGCIFFFIDIPYEETWLHVECSSVSISKNSDWLSEWVTEPFVQMLSHLIMSGVKYWLNIWPI